MGGSLCRCWADAGHHQVTTQPQVDAACPSERASPPREVDAEVLLHSQLSANERAAERKAEARQEAELRAALGNALATEKSAKPTKKSSRPPGELMSLRTGLAIHATNTPEDTPKDVPLVVITMKAGSEVVAEVLTHGLGNRIRVTPLDGSGGPRWVDQHQVVRWLPNASRGDLIEGTRRTRLLEHAGAG